MKTDVFMFPVQIVAKISVVRTKLFFSHLDHGISENSNGIQIYRNKPGPLVPENCYLALIHDIFFSYILIYNIDT